MLRIAGLYDDFHRITTNKPKSKITVLHKYFRLFAITLKKTAKRGLFTYKLMDCALRKKSVRQHLIREKAMSRGGGERDGAK